MDENVMILWQRFHALESNHPKFFTRSYQLVKTVYMVKGNKRAVDELDRLYMDYPPFHLPVSFIEDAFYACIGGSMAATVDSNGLRASVMDLNLHLNIFYGFLLYLMTMALFEKESDYCIDFAGASLSLRKGEKK